MQSTKWWKQSWKPSQHLCIYDTCCCATGRWRVSAERPTLYPHDVHQWRERPLRRHKEGQQQEPSQRQRVLNSTEQWQGNLQEAAIQAVSGSAAVNTAANSSSHYRQLTEQEPVSQDQAAEPARSGAKLTDVSLSKHTNSQLHFGTGWPGDSKILHPARKY